MSTILFSVVLVASLQLAPDVKGLFETGAYQQVVDEVTRSATDDPVQIYLAALSLQKLNRPDAATERLEALIDRGENDPWHFIGQSAVRLSENQLDQAQAAAVAAVEGAGDLCQAHYQHGLVLATKNDFVGAAAAFDRAATADARWAYAHYWAGLSYYRANRVDRMAQSFERFLKLAPRAPERGQVESIMRTIRGRRLWSASRLPGCWREDELGERPSKHQARTYCQFRTLPSVSHRIVVASRLDRVASVFASVSQSTYSRC